MLECNARRQRPHCKRQQEDIDGAEFAAVVDELRKRYDRETDNHGAAVRLWLDVIIDPAKTREVLTMAYNVAVPSRDTARRSTDVLRA